MKKIIVSMTAALVGLSLSWAQTFTMEANQKAIAEGDIIVVSGVVDNEETFSLKQFMSLTNQTAQTLKIQPSFDLSEMPEGSGLGFCIGMCYDARNVPVQEVEPNGVLGADNSMDAEYTPPFNVFDTAIVKCTFTNTENEESLSFYLKFIPQPKGRPDVANENRELAGVSVYPNPTAGAFSLTAPRRAHVEIFSANGQVIKQMEVAAGENALQLTNSGIYFVRVRANGKEVVKRVVVR